MILTLKKISLHFIFCRHLSPWKYLQDGMNPERLIWTGIIGTKGKMKKKKLKEKKIPLCMCTRAFGLWKLHSLRVSKLPLKWRDWKLLMAQASMIECKLGAFWCGPPVNTVEILLQRIRFVAPVLGIGCGAHNCWVSCNIRMSKWFVSTQMQFTWLFAVETATVVYHWAAKQQIWWVFIPFLWPSCSLLLPAPSSWLERRLHFASINLCQASGMGYRFSH